MTGRKGELSEAEQLRIGAQVLELRAATPAVAWKAIERMFDRDRDSLARYAAKAAKMRQENPEMRHPGSGPDHGIAG